MRNHETVCKRGGTATNGGLSVTEAVPAIRVRKRGSKGRLLLACCATIGLLAAVGFNASARAEDFYKGKSIDFLIGYPAGTGYDIYARLMADNIVRFIPGNPNVVPRNMPGAGSMRVTNYLYQVAKKDGTVWGAVNRDIPTEPLLYGKESKAAFKNPLELGWIGSMTTEIGVAAVWHTTGIKTWEEARNKPIIVAMASSHGGVSARAINSLLGANFKQVCCYGGDNNQNLAMERGEVEGRIGWSWSSLKATSMDWLKEGKITLLMQVGLQKNPEIPGDIPLVVDLAKSEKDKAALKVIFFAQSIGRPYLMPEGVPPDRLKIVRDAFKQMVKDPVFLAHAAKSHIEIDDPKSGEEVEELIKDIYATPDDVVAAARKAIKSGEFKVLHDRK
jgi:tripartite-type tricarboxylate transporter receptor subunit TctC